MISVLLVDDEPVLLDIGRMFLEKTGGFTVGQAASGEEALSLLQKNPYGAVVADYEMPEMDGLALLREVRSQYPELPFILFTGRGREEVVIEALNSGADFYLQKGGDPKAQFTELAHKIRQAVAARKASSEIRESEETFRQFFEAAGEAIIILDRERIVDSNHQANTLFARTRDEMIGRVPSELSTSIQPDGTSTTDFISANIELALSGSFPVFEWRIIRSDNSVIDTEVSMSCITIHGRRLIHAIIRDISLRKLDLKLRQMNELRLEAMIGLYSMRDNSLKEIIDFSLESAVTVTASEWGYLAFVSDDEKVLTLYSWSKNARDNTVLLNKPATYPIETVKIWADVIRTRQAVSVNSNIDDKDFPGDHPEIIRHMTVPVFDRENIVIIVGVINKQDPYDEEDIRQLHLLTTGMWGIIRRKKTEEILQKKNYELAAAYEQLRTIEENLRASEERYRGLVERSEDVIILLNEQFIPIYLSPAFSEITGYAEEKVLGRSLPLDMFSPEDQEKVRHMMDEAVSGHPISHFEIQVKSKAGTHVVLDMRCVPIYHQSLFTGVQVIGRDITSYKTLEKALVQANQRLTLLADLTRHDILNKLTVLGGFLDIVRDGCVPGDQITDTAGKAHDSIEAIKYLIEFTRDYQSLGIRDAEWIDAGEAFTIAASQLDLNQIQIINEYVGISIMADPLLSRAFYNLMENSLRHGKTVTSIHGYTKLEGSSLHLIFEDNGLGVKNSEKNQIFERGFGNNTGLGLFLVHEILSSTGFEISENGQPGLGARFQIIVPEGKFRIDTKTSL